MIFDDIANGMLSSINTHNIHNNNLLNSTATSNAVTDDATGDYLLPTRLSRSHSQT